MENWFNEWYINRRIWLLTHYTELKLSYEELTLFLLIDLFREKHILCNYENLAKYMGSNQTVIDRLITSLSTRGYLLTSLDKEGVYYDISPIFMSEKKREETFKKEENQQDLLELVSKTFGRPLSSTEIGQLYELSRSYRCDDIRSALRTCDAYQRYSVSYLEAVLRND